MKCVVRNRTVMVRAIIEYPVLVPEFWEEDEIFFHRNDSSWCSGNGLDEIIRLQELNDDGKLDACRYMEYEFVREATTEDEETFGIRVDEAES